jgi:hypothetical protein
MDELMQEMSVVYSKPLRKVGKEPAIAGSTSDSKPTSSDSKAGSSSPPSLPTRVYRSSLSELALPLSNVIGAQPAASSDPDLIVPLRAPASEPVARTARGGLAPTTTAATATAIAPAERHNPVLHGPSAEDLSQPWFHTSSSKKLADKLLEATVSDFSVCLFVASLFLSVCLSLARSHMHVLRAAGI